MIKPKYFEEDKAPMTYYMILKVLVIIWIITSSVRLLEFMGQANLLGMIEMIICITLQVLTAVGLYKKKWSGVIALYSYYAFQIVDILIALGIYFTFDALNAATVGECIGGILGVLIWAIPSWIYFSKRRPLFMPYAAPAGTASNGQQFADAQQSICDNSVSQNPDVAYEQPRKTIKYCNKCGFELFENSEFCSNCGAKLPRE